MAGAAALVLAGLAALLLAAPADAARPRCFGKWATIVGTSKDDRLRGTPRSDVIVGLGGADRIDGRGGNDYICGGASGKPRRGKLPYELRDVLDGGPGSDSLSGGTGEDSLDGGPGKDAVYGGPGDDASWERDGRARDWEDRVYGQAGDDHLTAGFGGGDTVDGGAGDDVIRGGFEGIDTLVGGPGDDELEARAGDDRLFGGPGVDHLDGGPGADLLDGGPGDDYEILFAKRKSGLFGGPGDDHLLGGSGDDELNGEEGADLLDGGPGADTMFGMSRDWVVGRPEDGGDTVTYASRTARVTADLRAESGDDDGEQLERDLIFDDVENLIGGAGDDVLTGSDAANRLEGGAGDDWIAGWEGKDLLEGGPGNDILYGDRTSGSPTGTALADTLRGGDGDDELIGQQGGDELHGEGGDDRLTGEAGDDVLRPGPGNDRAYGSDGSDTTYAEAGPDGNDLVHGDGGGGSGVDTIDYSARTVPVTLDDRPLYYVPTPVSGDLASGERDELRYHEKLVGGSAGDLLIGEGRLEGRAGNDVLWPVARYGDVSLGGDGLDTVSFERWHEHAVYVASSVPMSIDLETGLVLCPLNRCAGNVFEVENVIGSLGADTIVGTAGPNRILGLDRDDVLYGRAGPDSIWGGLGDDKLFGESGIDEVMGGKGADLRNGGAPEPDASGVDPDKCDKEEDSQPAQGCTES